MVSKMTYKQQISALMDGELVDQSLISEIEQDVDAQQSWNHYHLIGDTLRGETPANPNWDIASKVALALDDEPVHSKVVPFESKLEAQPKPQQARSKMPAWLSTLTQVGVAACVSLVVVFGVQQYSSTDTATPTADSDQLPVLQTIPFAGSAEPVSLTSEPVNAQSKEATVMEEHRRVNALMQDYELQLRLNHASE